MKPVCDKHFLNRWDSFVLMAGAGGYCDFSRAELRYLRAWPACLWRAVEAGLKALCLVAFLACGSAEAGELGDPYLMIDASGHTALVRALVFTRDGGLLVSGGDDKTVRIWDWRAEKTLRQIYVPAGPGEFGKIYALALSPDEKWLAVASEPRPYCTRANCIVIRIYDFKTGEVRRVLRDPAQNVVLSLAFSPDGGALVSGAQDGGVTIWDPATGNIVRRLEGHTDHVYSISYSPDGERVISAGDDASVFIWNPQTGLPIASAHVGDTPDLRAALSPSGDTLITGDTAGRIQLWNARTGEPAGMLASIDDDVGALSFDASGAYVISGPVPRRGLPQAPTVWRVADGANLGGYLPQTDATIGSAQAIPGTSLIATGDGEGAIHIWDVSTRETRYVLRGVGRRVWSVGLSDDGTELSWGQVWTGENHSGRGQLTTSLALPHGPWWWRTHLGAPRTNTLPAPPPGLAGTASGGDGVRSLEVRRGPPYNFENTLRILQDNKPIWEITRDTADGFRHTAFGFSPDRRYAISGGDNGFLMRYGLEARDSKRYIGHSSTIWSLAASHNGLLASGGSDQTICLWNLETGDLIVTLFYGTDHSWAMWTPQGRFAASPEGGRRVGWLLNDGLEQAPRFEQAVVQKELVRPDLVEVSILAHRSLDTVADGEIPLVELLRRRHAP